jgi:hypothetical protein
MCAYVKLLEVKSIKKARKENIRVKSSAINTTFIEALFHLCKKAVCGAVIL